MKLIVGLGNPGRKYQGTRHNIGFEVIQRLAQRERDGRGRSQFNSELYSACLRGQAVWLQMPQTFMNLSGTAVLAARDFYRVEPQDILVVCDDINLNLAQLRLRSSGSAGGQKGLEDILRRLGTNQIPRLRIGIGMPPPQWDAADFVLSRFNDQEQEIVSVSVAQACDAASDWVEHGIEFCMNRYNSRQSNPQKSGD